MKTWFYWKINKNHAIQIPTECFYKPLYNLSNIELAVLKKYIEKNGFVIPPILQNPDIIRIQKKKKRWLAILGRK